MLIQRDGQLNSPNNTNKNTNTHHINNKKYYLMNILIFKANVKKVNQKEKELNI